MKLAVVCRDGQMHVFEHVLNGSHKKPLAPTCTVQIATSGGDGDSTPKPVSILSAGFCPDKQSMVLYYGSSMQPLFEKLITKRLQGHPNGAMFMVRWVKAALVHHAPYLSALPDLGAQLGSLYQFLEMRVKAMQKLSRLNGKLYLLITQDNWEEEDEEAEEKEEEEEEESEKEEESEGSNEDSEEEMDVDKVNSDVDPGNESEEE
ncbi:hypothetical protein GDO78_022918 [Eleutherodactylus coqui]|uniref:Small-subunit processome Utp12 domain-containing protein n=1 Tax=Eleutherodactylus coqui TaxID=57060 RepID=A0A8J6C4J7_ELECQ|nr:hypothetical protein GDO78_022918 [Eleutherodactylus coqui]